MNSFGIVSDMMSIRLTVVLAHFLWQGCLIGSLVALLARVFGRAPAQTRYVVLVAGLVAMGACPVVTFFAIGTVGAPHNTFDMDGAARPTGFSAGDSSASLGFPRTPDKSPDDAWHPVTVDLVPVPVEPDRPPASHEAGRLNWRPVAPWIAMVYLSGVTLLILRLSFGICGGRRLCRQSEPLDDGRLLDILARQAKVLGLYTRPPLAWCSEVAVPTVVGILRPTILLPLSLASGFPPEQLEAIMLHELAHIRRFDHWVNIFQRLIEAILFFHPAVWLVSRRIRIEREHCCDDLVISSGTLRTTYARALLHVAEWGQLHSRCTVKPALLAVFAVAHRSRLHHRIMRIHSDSHAHRVRVTCPVMSLPMFLVAVLAIVTIPLQLSGKRDFLDAATHAPINSATIQPAVMDDFMIGDAEPFVEVKRLGDERLRHWNAVLALAYSPDGLLLASAGRDGAVIVWDSKTGQKKWAGSHSEWAYSVAFSPDGKILASGGSPRSIWAPPIEIIKPGFRFFGGGATWPEDSMKLWDVASGKELFSTGPKTKGSSVTRVAFNRAGTIVAAASSEVELYDVATRQRVSTLKGHVDGDTAYAIYALDFSPDGLTLASGATDGKVKLWNVASADELHTIHNVATSVTSLAFTTDGKKLLSGGRNGEVKLWHVNTGQAVGNLPVANVEFMSLDPDGQTLLTFDSGSMIRRWSFGSAQPSGSIRLSSGYPFACAVHEENKVVASNEGQIIHTCALAFDGNSQKRDVMAPSYGSAQFSPDGRTLAAGTIEGTVDLWETATWQRKRTLSGHKKWVSSIAFDPTAESIAALGDENGVIRIWDTATGADRHTISLDKRAFPIAYCPDGKWLAVGDTAGFVRLWNTQTKTLTTLRDVKDTVPPNHTRVVRGLAFSQDGKVLVSSRNSAVKIWDVTAKRELFELRRPLRENQRDKNEGIGIVSCVAISRDGRTIAAGDSTRVISLLDATTGQTMGLLEGHDEEVSALAFDVNGTSLLSAGGDGTLRSWDVRSGALRKTVRLGPPSGRIHHLALSPDASLVAIVTGAGTVQVLRWDNTLPSEKKISSKEVLKPKPREHIPASLDADEPPVNCSLTAKVVGLDETPVKKAIIEIWCWKVLVNPALQKSGEAYWRDAKTGKTWRLLRSAATGDSLTEEKLTQGQYRVTARADYEGATTVGISEPVELTAKHPQQSVIVRLALGGSLILHAMNAKTKQRMPTGGLSIQPTAADGGVPPTWIFQGREHRGDQRIDHLPAGTYKLTACAAAGAPDLDDYLADDVVLSIDGNPKGGETEITFLVTPKRLTKEQIAERWPFVAFGRVRHADGRPGVVVPVVVHCGLGTLFETGRTSTNADGTYELRFRTGMQFPRGQATVQAVMISTELGLQDAVVNHQGGWLAAMEPPADDAMRAWGLKSRDDVFLPNQPKRIDFVLSGRAKVSGRLFGRDGKPLADYRIALVAERLRPDRNMMASACTDATGRFQFRDVVAGDDVLLLIEPPKGEQPERAWACGPISFYDPGQRDLEAVHFNTEYSAKQFTIALGGTGETKADALRKAIQGIGTIQMHNAKSIRLSDRFRRVEADQLEFYISAGAVR